MCSIGGIGYILKSQSIITVLKISNRDTNAQFCVYIRITYMSMYLNVVIYFDKNIFRFSNRCVIGNI